MNLKFEIVDVDKVNIIAKKGTTWIFMLQLTDENGNPLDITNKSFYGSIKRSYYDKEAIAEFTINKKDNLNGLIEVKLSADITKTIPCGESYKDSISQYLYDIIMVDNETNEVTRILQGKIMIDPAVTII